MTYLSNSHYLLANIYKTLKEEPHQLTEVFEDMAHKSITVFKKWFIFLDDYLHSIYTEEDLSKVSFTYDDLEHMYLFLYCRSVGLTSFQKSIKKRFSEPLKLFMTIKNINFLQYYFDVCPSLEHLSEQEKIIVLMQSMKMFNFCKKSLNCKKG